MFDRLLLTACLCVVAALILYFFYWNRFIAFVIGQVIRVLFWNQEGSSIWIEIGSIHFSLLTGRILLKDIQYHSSNQTIKIVKGQIQWRYWIRKPTSEEETNSTRGEDVKHTSRLWSCRIQLSFQGMEWFLYNRTAAYDNIIEQIEKANRPASRTSSHGRFFGRFSRPDNASFYPPPIVRASMRLPEPVKKAMAWFRCQLPTLDPKDLLPLGIDIQTGAIILGNPSTPNLLVAEFQNALGHFGVAPSRSRYDLYKQVLNLKFQNPVIQLVPNEDYVDPMTTLGSLVHHRVKGHSTLRKPYFYQSYRTFFKLWRHIKLYGLITDYFATRKTQRINSQSFAFSSPFKKSKKTANEDTPVGIDFSAFEYAVERKILESPALDLTYYVDVVGEVPARPATTRYPSGERPDIGNGDTAPEWGIDLIIHGGFVRYGPWADRQRAELQRAFFPPTYLDSDVTQSLKPGDKRTWVALQVFVELRDETTLHIPFREPSKDWQWDGAVNVPQRPRLREAASISVAVGDRSSISYIMPLVVGPSGYESTLEVHLDSISVTSSLNDIRLVSAESCRVRCELPAPIHWDVERTWTIAVSLRQPVLFLLRDHINMISDLGRDWVSGPPTDYQKFIPMIYVFRLEMHHFEMNLYANDQNIVDKPLIKEENALVTITGPHVESISSIPSNTYRPESTAIPFEITANDVSVNCFLPRWNTHSLHASKQGINILKTNGFTLSGSYRYFAEIREEEVEQLKLQFEIKDATFQAYGWSIRYFMVLRDNYLGSFTHFQTLSEYLDKRRRRAPVGDPIGLKYRPGKANMLQITIGLRAEGLRFLLPIGLIGDTTQHAPGMTTARHEEDQNCLALKTSELQLHLRMHDYFMEMCLNLDVITAVIQRGRTMPRSLSGSDSSSQREIFMIDGIDITTNRLFGPQPRTATYLCIWEIAVGHVKAFMSAIEARRLAAAGESFLVNFVDLVNAPADEFLPVVDPDVTFYKITVKTIDMTCRVGHVALVVQMLHGLDFDSNDLGTDRYRKVTSLKIPHLCISILLNASMERNTWLEALAVVLDVYMDMYDTPAGHRSVTREQLAFVEEQDRLTGRAKRMFSQLMQQAKVDVILGHSCHRNGVYLPQPTLPKPSSRITSNPTQQTSAPTYKSPSWRHSNLGNLSDSDGEERVSEADRDARLARTRTSTPVPECREDDVMMSSGDESDDADLTDGDSLGGEDWSDTGDFSNEPITNSLILFYSPIVRHYVPNWRETSRSWEGTSFEMTKEAAPFVRRDSHYSHNDIDYASRGPNYFEFPEDIPRDENLTTFCVKLHKNTVIVITPLLVPAAMYLEELKDTLVGPEMCVDSLIADCLARITAKETSKSLVFQFELPRATIQLIQHVAISEEGSPSIAKAMQAAAIPSSLDMTTVLNFALVDFHLSGIVGEKSLAINASLKEATGALNTSIDKRTLTVPDSSIAEFIISISSIKLSQRSLWTNLDLISTKIGNPGPELIAATLVALLSMGKHISEIARGLKLYHLQSTRVVIANVLNASEQQGPAVDSLSTIQPSYLVQTGSPQLLRTDATFKFLYHLRNCVWNMSDWEHRSLFENRKAIDLSDLSSLVESRLVSLDQDVDSIDHLTSIDPLLFSEEDQIHPKPQKQEIHAFDLVSIQVKMVTVTVLDSAGGSSSQFMLNNLRLDVQSRSLDLVQFNSSNLSSISQTSLRSRTPKTIWKMVVIVSLESTTLGVSPHLMHFAQHLLRVKRQISSGLDFSPVGRESLDKFSNYSSKLYSLEIIAVVHRLRIKAAAENLVLVMGIDGIKISTALLAAHNQVIQSMSFAILFNEVYFQARSPANPAEESDQDVLAAIAFKTGRTSLVARPETGSRRNVKLVFAFASLSLHVPRSALRLYRFIGEWRADYLPGIEAAIKTLLSEYKAGPAKPRSPAPSRLSGRGPILQIHGQIVHFGISLQVMHGTWLSLEVNQTVAYFHSSSAMMTGEAHAFGLQTASTIVSISSKPNAKEVAPSSRVKLVLPALSVAGQSNGYRVHTLILIELIRLNVKPSHWDTLLSVQQKFGQDFNDLVALMQKTRQKDRMPLAKPISNQKVAFQYEAHMEMRGFRIGLQGVSSTILLECQDIHGGFSNTRGWTWDISLSDLALSLAPRTSGSQNVAFNRDHKSAFVIIDFKFSGSNSDAPSETTLVLTVSKIHAVMQPSSIGEFGDFIDNLQAELLERQEQRALELAAFKEKTQSILKTFDVNAGDVQLEKTSWINDLVIGLSVRSIGVAFPLTHDDELVLPPVKGKESTPVRAFLFSIKSIEFRTNRGETGQAVMQRLSFQFVSRFQQSIPEDFAAERHQTRNCLLYPQMTAQLRSSSIGPSRKIWIKADVSGFILDIDSAIPKYIFSLIDVYRQGKERVERLSTNVPRTPSSIPFVEEFRPPPLEKHYTAIPTSNVFMSFVFRSGKVRLYSGTASNLFMTKILPSKIFLEMSDEQVLELGAEVFNLPVVSVWGEYRATPAVQKLSKEPDHNPSILMFNSTVHSSSNVLRPTLLPFLTELVDHIESRVRKVSTRSRPPSALLSPSAASLSRIDVSEVQDSISSMQMCFSLRIDQSSLELTCQPDVNVVAGLHWDSGGFVLNVSPGAREVSFIGSVGGLTVGLKHGFLSEDCVKLDARNLALSASFNRMELEAGDIASSISVVLDTEFLGAVRFSRLQDILCFKAVWLDHIPIFNKQTPTEEIKLPSEPTFSTSVDASPDAEIFRKRAFSTIILVQIRNIRLDFDLGQSITRINLGLHDSIFKTKLTDDLKEVFLFVGDVSVTSLGNLSGHASVSSLAFQTTRRSEVTLWDDDGKSKMLELRLTSGALVVALDSDHQQLLHYRAEPLEVKIFDNWSKVNAPTEHDAQSLQLSFTVTCPEVFAAVTVGTIPKLLSYMNKFKANLDVQRQGASRESQTFRATRTPKPDNHLSAVAQAMLHSARSRFKEADSDLSYTTRQHMSLQLKVLRLIVFARSMRDLEIAQFISRDIHAQLDGVVGTDSTPAKRDLHLSFSSMIISRFNQFGHLSASSFDRQFEADWPMLLFKDATEAIIIGLPSMRMHMISEETVEDSVTTLVYDFHSKFVRRAGMKAFEDIYITLNMSLYSWLTLLRKNLTREMEQVRATEDWRTSVSSVSAVIATGGSQRKKKIPDPLSLNDTTRSSTLSSASTAGLTPGLSARHVWMEQSKSPQSSRDFSYLAQPSSPPLQFPTGKEVSENTTMSKPSSKSSVTTYKPRKRHIERLTMRQLGEATPDVMHPFFMKKAGFNLEDSLPQYVHEYATRPLEEIMEILIKLYSQQLLKGARNVQE